MRHSRISRNSQHRTEEDDSFENGERFDSFLEILSLENNREGERDGLANPSVMTRNKVAFFKKSLVLIKNSEIEIAFKRSDLSSELNELRMIIYVKNKTNYRVQIASEYREPNNDISITTKEKLSSVEPYSQSREVLLLRMKDRGDLNSLISANYKIDRRTYDFWVPANFIRLDYHYQKGDDFVSTTVKPNRQFANYEDAADILPLVKKEYEDQQITAIFYGKSKSHNGVVKLAWK